MIKHHLRELTKFFGSQIDPEKSEELKRTKSDIENNLSRILKLIKDEDQSKRDANIRKETELEGLIEDFYNQYQSLYALYGRITGEYVNVVPLRVKRVSSVSSSSSSESEYFSSEETDGNKRRSEIEHHNVFDTAMQELRLGNTVVNHPNQMFFSKERERSTLSNTHEVFKTQESIEAKEFEEKLTSQAIKLENLNQLKMNLELQFESQAHEVTHLTAKNTKLEARVLEVELLLKKKEDALSALKVKLKNNEDQANSKIAELVAGMNKLEQEAKSLRTQKGKMEEKLRSHKNEVLTLRKDFTDQLKIMQQNLDSACNQNKELEDQLEREREKAFQYLFQIENLKENLAETTLAEQRMQKEKERFLARIKDLELEVESRCSNQNDLEEQLRDASYETNRLAEETKALHDRNHELERTLTHREQEIRALLRGHKNGKNGASTHVMYLTAEIDDLRLELDTLQEEKSKLELQNKRSQKEYSESIATMENLNLKLQTQVADQEETIKKQTETINQIRAENKQAKNWSKKLKLSQRFTERKIEELAEEFRKKMEDNIRLLHQRIHVAEQLNNLNKDSYKITKQKYEQENKMLGEKIASYEDELRTIKVMGTPLALVGDLEVIELCALNGLDLAAGKLEEHREYVVSIVSKMLGEVQFAKDWIKKTNGEIKQLKDNVDSLTKLLGDKEEHELLLREKVWKLEASLSKEGGDKLNLMKAVRQLEKKVGKLEKNLKEKDEELVGLAEMKRESIRQLCFLVEFHRERCNHLKGLVTKTRAPNRT